MKNSKRYFALAASMLLLLEIPKTPPAYTSSIYHTDPPAVVTFSSPELTILRKELSGFPNHGVADGQSDILYSTESDQWNFDLSGVSLPGPVQSAEFLISLVLDDHYGRPESDYVGRILVNGTEVFSAGFSIDLAVSHGTPFGAIFGNWKEVTFQVDNLSPSPYTVLIENNTTGQVFGDWIAIDCIELHLHTATIVALDIKPGRDSNRIDPKSKLPIPVAILTTATFDAITVDPLSVRFGPAGAPTLLGIGLKFDVDRDGDRDLLLAFRTQETGIQCGDTEASLTGQTFDGQAITGTDAIQTIECGLGRELADAEEEENLPDGYALEQNYPNPFNPETEIRFALPQASHVIVKIFDTLGDEIHTLVDEQRAAGYHTVRWDGKDVNGNVVASGVYLYQLQVGTFCEVKKMALVR